MTYQSGKLLELDRNPNYDPATDRLGRKALPDKLTVQIGINAADLDNRLMLGDLDVDIAGTGVAGAAQGKILASEDLKKNIDDPTSARSNYNAINTDVAPFENIACRKAVLLAYDRTGYERAYGGTIGAIATSLLPDGRAGARRTWMTTPSRPSRRATRGREGRAAKCGKPDGFETIVAYRNERPKEKAVAKSQQQSLAKAGIRRHPQGLPAATTSSSTPASATTPRPTASASW